MSQIMMDLASPGEHWMVVKKSDYSCRLLADRHYSRRKVGDKQFCRPGKNLVLRTPAGDAVWVTWYGIRDDGIDAWECTIFRNESEILSSELIIEALRITQRKWGDMPPDGIITYVDAKKIKSRNPGYCFKVARFEVIGESKVNHLTLLQYKGKRGS